MADPHIVLDTDLVIDFLRDARPGADFVDRLLREGSAAITAVSVFELVVGGGEDLQDSRLAPLFARRTLPLDLKGAIAAGEIDRDLSGRGEGSGAKDAMIAGICRRFDLPLATRNVRHFERVPGLRLVAV